MKTKETKMIKAFLMAMSLAFFCSQGVFAQQLITFRSGLQVRAIVVEMTADTVRYYPENEPNNKQSMPMFLVSRITDVGKTIRGKDLAYWDKKAKKYTAMTAIGAIFLTAGGIMAAVGVSDVNKNESGTSGDVNGAGLFMGGLIFVIGGTTFTAIGAGNLAKANHEIRKYKLEVGPNPVISGVTVRLKF